jgi:hypothetical protein
MRLLVIVIGLYIGVATAAEAGSHHRPAPAPLIGSGIPAVLVVGGVLLGAKVLTRRRQA